MFNFSFGEKKKSGGGGVGGTFNIYMPCQLWGNGQNPAKAEPGSSKSNSQQVPPDGFRRRCKKHDLRCSTGKGLKYHPVNKDLLCDIHRVIDTPPLPMTQLCKRLSQKPATLLLNRKQELLVSHPYRNSLVGQEGISFCV